MSLVKKIAICTGFSEPENEGDSRQPIWTTQEIGVNANNVILPSSILGQNNLNSLLNNVLPQTFQDYNRILGLNEYGIIQETGVPISWLSERYAEWLEEHSNQNTPDELEGNDPNNNEENQNNSGDNEENDPNSGDNEGNENGSEGNEGEENSSGNENITVPTESGNEEPEEP